MKNLTAFAGIALVFIYVIGSGLWVNTGDGWYRSLNQPAWQPPDFIFGIIWPYNFVVLGIALVPYQIWVATAASISYGYSKLN
jgi:tryptophan-rich sensory protein